MKKLVVFTGAGISAESGLKTFRDNGGLWENHNITDVATPEAWEKDPGLVLHFYNERRRKALEAQPNRAHKLLAELEDKYDVTIITQNIDDLHERAGSRDVLHLHGEITKCRSSIDEKLIYDWAGDNIKLGDVCEKGSQIRPHIVWFGEDVPNMLEAYEIVQEAEIFVVVGTSLNVYPAAGLVHFTQQSAPKFLVDPGDIRIKDVKNLVVIRQKATTGVSMLIDNYL